MGRWALPLYWALVGLWALELVVYFVLHGDWRHSVGWLVALALPPLVASADLIVFNRSHELVCRRVAVSNRWLRPLQGSWVTCRTFSAIGWFTVAMTIVAVLYAGFNGGWRS